MDESREDVPTSTHALDKLISLFSQRDNAVVHSCSIDWRRLAIVLILTQTGCSAKTTLPPTTTSGQTVATGSELFRDVTDESGLSAVFRNGEDADRYSILEVMGGGCAAIDYDGDGLLDLFFPGGGYFDGPDKKQIRGVAPKLFRNLGGFKFQDVSADTGLTLLADGQPWFYSHGAAACDYDRDGWTDLLMTGYGRVALWHNESDGVGGRRFREVTKEAGLLGPHFWATSAAWGDLDGDGLPDLYICHYLDWSNDNDPVCPGTRTKIARDVCPPRQFQSRPHRLYRNLGNGKFEDVTKSSGIRADRADGQYGKGLGCLFADLDSDGKPEIYVCNDGEDNFLYLNCSVPGRMKFEEKGLELGVARDSTGMANGSMGVDVGDVDGTGRPAIWVTNYENEFHALYHLRSGKGMFFEYSSPRYGLTAIGSRFVGFGTVFVDADLDGWEDIVIANGHVVRHSPTNNIRQRPILFLNVLKGERRQFIDAATEGGPFFREPRIGRGVVVADLDNDGRPDLVYCHINETARVLKNESMRGNHWFGVELIGRDRRDATGAKLSLVVDKRTVTRLLTGGRSYLSSCDHRRLFGLGANQSVGRLTVEWASGLPRKEHWDALPIDRYHPLRQGSGRVSE